MIAFALSRLVRLAAVLIAITIVSFGFIHGIQGDPVAIRLGDHSTPEQAAALRSSLGLDQPWFVQLARYLGALLHGDLGSSIFDQQPIVTKLEQHFPATVELSLAALVFAVFIGIPIGIVAAVRHRSLIDSLASSLALLGVSVPIFWLGYMLVLASQALAHVLGIREIFPVSGGQIAIGTYVPARTHLVVVDALLAGNAAAAGDALRHLVLPAVALGTIPLAIIAKITRGEMLEVLHSDYIRTARAKGLAFRAVVLRHALRSALIPIITIVGLQAGLLLGGAILTENVFAWPGVGRLAFDAVGDRDFPLINGCILLFASVFVIVNVAVDLLYAVANPRIRYG